VVFYYENYSRSTIKSDLVLELTIGVGGFCFNFGMTVLNLNPVNFRVEPEAVNLKLYP